MSKYDEYRALVYFRQSVIQRWLGKIHRGRICVRNRLPDAKFVGAVKNNDRAKYVNLMLCKNLWTCPYCANIASHNRRNTIQRAITALDKQGASMAFVTYTIRHSAKDSLETVLSAVLTAHAATHSGKGWKTIEARHDWIGSIKICEVTDGVNGWHFHLHEIGFIKGAFNREKLEGDLIDRWLSEVQKAGGSADREHGLKIKNADSAVRDYVSKWGLVPELASGADKKAHRDGALPFQFPDIALQTPKRAGWARTRFEEYAKAIKGVKQIWASPSVRPFMTHEINDDKGGTFDETQLHRLTDGDWQLIKRRGVRALFLSYFEHGLVDEFLEALYDQSPIPKLEG
jgi:hypothetical protein